MEEIKLHIEKAEKISDFYNDNIKDILDIYSLEIKNKFIELLNKYDNKYDLILNNSVYDKIALYEFIDRVKKAESLKDKLIRKGQIFYYEEYFESGDIIKDIMDDTCENKIEYLSKNKLCKKICDIDDLIGIKILTSLKVDCKSVFDLIKQNISEIDSIELDLSENVPDIMNNGREIYKIKGLYKGIIKFELQIKSKIDSAWGDLEHNLFYKDYDFNYIKNTNKDVMVNVGNLLDQIEHLMLAVRNNKINFNNQYQELGFKNDISKVYSEKVLGLFKSKHILEDNLDLLYFLYTNSIGEYKSGANVYRDDIKVYNIVYDGTNILTNYQRLRSKNFVIPLIELIYINWMDANEKYSSDKEIVIKLLELIIKYRMIEYKKITNIELVYEDFIDNLINILSNNEFRFKSVNLLLDKKMFAYLEVYNAMNAIKMDILDGQIDDYLDVNEDNINEFIDNINLILFKHIIDDENIDICSDDDEYVFLNKTLNKILKSKEDDNLNEKHSKIVNDAELILDFK